jgi:transcriptional regulator with XRE-family HTH domain
MIRKNLIKGTEERGQIPFIKDNLFLTPKKIEDFYRAIGKHLKLCRHVNQFPIKFLAEVVGVSPTQYDKYENGTTKISTFVLKLLCSLFEIKMPNYEYLIEPASRENFYTIPKLVNLVEKAPHATKEEIRKLRIDYRTYIGKKLRFYRYISNMSQADIAKKIGVTFQQLQKYENGKDNIQLYDLIILCNYFKSSTLEEFLKSETNVKF